MVHHFLTLFKELLILRLTASGGFCCHSSHMCCFFDKTLVGMIHSIVYVVEYFCK